MWIDPIHQKSNSHSSCKFMYLVCLTECCNIYNQLTVTMWIWQKPAVTSYCLLSIPPFLKKGMHTEWAWLGMQTCSNSRRRIALAFLILRFQQTPELSNNLRWFNIYKLFYKVKKMLWQKLHSDRAGRKLKMAAGHFTKLVSIIFHHGCPKASPRAQCSLQKKINWSVASLLW